MKQAIILDGKVINIVEVSGDTPVGISVPEGQFTYDIGTIPVAIGDNFTDGVFSRDGKCLEPLPTVDEILFGLERQLTETNLAIAELGGIVAGGV